jgi:hypothetical protein
MNIQDEMDRIFKMQKENQGQLFIDAETFDTRKEAEDFLDGERKSSEDEERNLYCVCGELKTACPDGYAHTTGGA